MSKLQNIIERACRTWFPGERLWIDYRPDWLFGMEIDLFLPDLQIAIEVQGHQHHLFVPDLQHTVENHQAQVARDKRKKHLIRQRGIAFFTVHCINLVMGGLQQKLTNHLHRRLQTPAELRKEWNAHRRFLNTSKKLVRFKLKRGALIPVNKASAKLLKKLRRANPTPFMTTSTNFPSASIENKVIVTRPELSGSAGLQPAERVRLASAHPQQVALPGTRYTETTPAMACACPPTLAPLSIRHKAA